MILGSLMTKRWERKGLTQQKFFEKTGISTGTWSRLMRGKAHFQMEDLRSACRVLGCTVSQITAEADQAELELSRNEGVRVVSQQEAKADASILPTIIAGAVLAFLLAKILKAK